MDVIGAKRDLGRDLPLPEYRLDFCHPLVQRCLIRPVLHTRLRPADTSLDNCTGKQQEHASHRYPDASYRHRVGA